MQNCNCVLLYWYQKKERKRMDMCVCEMFPAEQVIQSVDRVLTQLGWTPWAFRLEEDGTLTADKKCLHKDIVEIEEETDEECFQRTRYIWSVWEEYRDLFSLSPFAFDRCELVQEFDELDIYDMTWAEIMEQFLVKELPLVRAILRAPGYWHKPVPEHVSDDALNQMIAFRYKERLLNAMAEQVSEDDFKEE